MRPAITVQNLGKRYKLGLTHTDLLSEKMGNGLRAIGKFLRLSNSASASTDKPQSKEKDSFWAVQDINFEVQPGEVMGVIGGNGAGKSTLLKILSRITSPTTGEIQLRGRVSSLLEVGTGFHPELTGRENIFLNGAILGMTRSEIKEKFEEIVSFAEVSKFIDTPVKRYSSGMYVRLAFAVAAHLEPEILLVDEVLAVGDAAFQKKCLNKMNSVAVEGRTVVFVSHNMESIKRLCSKVIWLEQGRLVQEGPTVDCVTNYQLRNLKERGVNNTLFPYIFSNQIPLIVHSVSLFDESGEEKDEFPSTIGIRVQIEWESTADIFKPRLGIIVQTAEGIDVMTTLDSTSSSDGWLSQGRRISTCTIPENILNEGEYLIELCADALRLRKNHEAFDLSSSRDGPLLRFHVVDGGMIPGKYYGEDGVMDRAWPGGIMIPIKWKQIEAHVPTNH